jgi:hypothetical protein
MIWNINRKMIATGQHCKLRLILIGTLKFPTSCLLYLILLASWIANHLFDSERSASCCNGNSKKERCLYFVALQFEVFWRELAINLVVCFMSGICSRFSLQLSNRFWMDNVWSVYDRTSTKKMVIQVAAMMPTQYLKYKVKANSTKLSWFQERMWRQYPTQLKKASSNLLSTKTNSWAK